MGVRARIDHSSKPRQARQEEISFFIIPGKELSLNDFLDIKGEIKHSVQLPQLANHLRLKLGQAHVEVYEKKGPYLRRLYGALRGMKSSVPDREAKHAARTFSNFMAYKPVKSISDFVSKEVLEPKDLSEDIRQVSELMKTIHAMDEETRQLKSSLENLDHAQQSTDQIICKWINRRVNRYRSIISQRAAEQKSYLASKKQQVENINCIEDTENQLAQQKDKRKFIHKQLVILEARRQGISELKDKDDLEALIQDNQDKLGNCLSDLFSQEQQFEDNYHAAMDLRQNLSISSLGKEIPALESRQFQLLIKQVVNAGQSFGINTQEILTKDWLGLSSLETKFEDIRTREHLHKAFTNSIHQPTDTATDSKSIRDLVLTYLDQKKEQLQKLQHQFQLKQQLVQALENKSVRYPAHVENALAAINQHCPDARPCVLCDFIEVVDSRWQMAIEGYIGGARYSIIVDGEYEAEAIRIVRSIKGKRNNSRVIQGQKAKADASRLNISSSSIIEVMNFNHRTAEDYILASYGSVQRVEDESELSHCARGITSKGLASGNYSMFRCDIHDSDLVFGQEARARALTAQKKQLSELSDQLAISEEETQIARRFYQLIERIKPVECSGLIEGLLKIYREINDAETRIENLDLSDFKDIEDQLSQTNSELELVDQKTSELNENLGAYKLKTKTIDNAIKKQADQIEGFQKILEKWEFAVREISQFQAEFDSQAVLEQAEQTAQQQYDCQEDNSLIEKDIQRLERSLGEAIVFHNQSNNNYNNIAYFIDQESIDSSRYLQQLSHVQQQCSSIYNALKNNILVDKHDKLASLKDSFNTAFVTNLCHSIHQSINHGKRVLDELNKELEHHRFGADRERFYFAYDWVPEFREYQRFFKEVIDIPNLGDGSTLFDVELSDKSREVRDKLLNMLLEKDELTAQRELQRISDYRHYRRYEIYKEPLNKEPIPLSTYGTGSGGQLETPAYIIRSAAVTSAFRFNDGSSHCRMVLVDEAFSKMDETRSREVINYLTESLGLQLIFIMPTSKSGPFMDLISNQVVFSKCPTTEKTGELNTRVLVDRKTCNHAEIKNLWDRHRRTIRAQNTLPFMEEILSESP